MRTIIILTAVIWQTVHAFTCTTQGTFSNPDDTTCQSYVFCALLPSGIYISNVYSCTTGNVYDPNQETCDQNYICNSIKEKTTLSTTPPAQDEFNCLAQGRFPDDSDTTCSSYYFCFYLTSGQYVKRNYSCPQGSKFDPKSQTCSISYECVTNTTESTVSSVSSISPSFECTAQGRFSVEDDVTCSTYYFCYFLPSGEYYRRNYSCPQGSKFDPSSQTCSTIYNCIGNVTETTVDSLSSVFSTVSPGFTCTAQGRFPVDDDVSCNSYYFCYYLTDGRYSRYNYTCPSNSKFDPILQTCSTTYACVANNPTSTPLISVRSDPPLLRASNSNCTKPGRFSVENDTTCVSYYFCYYSTTGQYIKYNYRCPNGSKFNETSQTCSTTYVCSSKTTASTETTVTTVTTMSSSSLETSTKASLECTKQGRISAEDMTCRSYYYCIYLPNGTYIQQKYSCPSGSTFDPTTQLCSQTFQCTLAPKRDTSMISSSPLKMFQNAVTRYEAFECVSTGKFPDLRSTSCQNYYYCFFLPNRNFGQQLYGCSAGENFDPEQQKCSSDYHCPFSTTTETITTQFECINEGKFFAEEDPTCQTYHYCFSIPNGGFGHQLYSCASGQRFDPKQQTCSQSYQCHHSTTEKPYTSFQFKCSTTGKFPAKGDSSCQTYYYCLLLPIGQFEKQLFTCALTEKFDPNLQICRQNYRCLY